MSRLAVASMLRCSHITIVGCLAVPLALSAAVLPGCQAGGDQPGQAEIRADAAKLFFSDPAPAGSEKRYLLVVQLRMVGVEVPAGMVSSSEQIWSYLDEEAVGQARSPLLSLNGLRVGRGRAASWEDLARLLRQMTGRAVSESVMTALPGDPVPIVLKTHQATQTIFTFGPDGELRGADYPPGENLLTICCTLNPDDPSEVLVTGLPQIRTARRRTRLINSNGRLVMADRPDIYSLGELTFQLSVPSKDFLVVGPGINATRPSSAGHNFLVKEREGMEFETVLVIRAEVVAAPARARP